MRVIINSHIHVRHPPYSIDTAYVVLTLGLQCRCKEAGSPYCQKKKKNAHLSFDKRILDISSLNFIYRNSILPILKVIQYISLNCPNPAPSKIIEALPPPYLLSIIHPPSPPILLIQNLIPLRIQAPNSVHHPTPTHLLHSSTLPSAVPPLVRPASALPVGCWGIPPIPPIPPTGAKISLSLS